MNVTLVLLIPLFSSAFTPFSSDFWSSSYSLMVSLLFNAVYSLKSKEKQNKKHMWSLALWVCIIYLNKTISDCVEFLKTAYSLYSLCSTIGHCKCTPMFFFHSKWLLNWNNTCVQEYTTHIMQLNHFCKLYSLLCPFLLIQILLPTNTT